MNPLARSEKLVIQQADDDLLVYDLVTDKAICLNKTSALIWENCDGTKDFQQIAEVVEKKFGELVSEDFVKFAVNQLKKENLIANKDEVATGFDGISRREVVKRIGLGSMIALPIVASLAAPSAAHAQSSCNPANGRGTACQCPAGTAANTECGQQSCQPGCLCFATQNGIPAGAGTCGGLP